MSTDIASQFKNERTTHQNEICKIQNKKAPFQDLNEGKQSYVRIVQTNENSRNREIDCVVNIENCHFGLYYFHFDFHYSHIEFLSEVFNKAEL